VRATAHGVRAVAEARAVAERADVDAIVSDLDLGGGATGMDAIAAVRAPRGREVPALIVTGDTSPEMTAAARCTGLLVMHEPIAPARLRAALAGLLRRPPTLR